MSPDYIEFEHKFLVGPNFNFKSFRQKLLDASPLKSYDVEVEDTYFWNRSNPNSLYRHRKDKHLHQLTYKSVGSDTESRTEINLDLQPHCPQSTVEAFLSTIGNFERTSIQKMVSVFYYEDVEIVYYKASSKARVLHCVEFEVRNFTTKKEALATLYKHEKEYGFNADQRSMKSLLELFSQED